MSDNMPLIAALGSKFIARKDVKSWQGDDGGWYPPKCAACKKEGIICLHNPMEIADFDAHFAGTKTMGHYLINPEDQTTKLFAYDLDVRKPSPPDANDVYAPLDVYGQPYNPREAYLDPSHPNHNMLKVQLRTVAEGIARRANRVFGISVAIADSGGKGLHVYCFTGPIPGEAAVLLAHQNLEETGVWTAVRGKNFWRYKHAPDFQDIEIETFPKQGTVAEDRLGNLMSLPLGVNRKTGKPKRFLTTNSTADVYVEMDPIRVLEGDLPWE